MGLELSDLNQFGTERRKAGTTAGYRSAIGSTFHFAAIVPARNFAFVTRSTGSGSITGTRRDSSGEAGTSTSGGREAGTYIAFARFTLDMYQLPCNFA